MEGDFYPPTFGHVYFDFKGRRKGLIKALTTDFEEFFQQCDPEMPNLCLYGYANGQWEVTFPVEIFLSDLPKPLRGINRARNRMQEKDWLSLIAIHCDCWLLAVSFYFGAAIKSFNNIDRNGLFEMINSHPTVYEVVTKHWRENSSSSNSSDENMIRSNVEPFSELQPKVSAEGLDKEEDKDGDTLCSVCCRKFESGEFRIFCEFCKKWFHAKCVKITPETAEHIKKYICRSCGKKKTPS